VEGLWTFLFLCFLFLCFGSVKFFRGLSKTSLDVVLEDFRFLLRGGVVGLVVRSINGLSAVGPLESCL